VIAGKEWNYGAGQTKFHTNIKKYGTPSVDIRVKKRRKVNEIVCNAPAPNFLLKFIIVSFFFFQYKTAKKVKKPRKMMTKKRGRSPL
jgi:hypothetical protein